MWKHTGRIASFVNYWIEKIGILRKILVPISVLNTYPNSYFDLILE
jgi:hypothetical protein